MQEGKQAGTGRQTDEQSHTCLHKYTWVPLSPPQAPTIDMILVLYSARFVRTFFRLFVRPSVCLSLCDSITRSFCNKDFCIFLFASIYSYNAKKSSNFDCVYCRLPLSYLFIIIFYFIYLSVYLVAWDGCALWFCLFLTISCRVFSISACCKSSFF